jgi:hypothetical protein
MKNRNPVRRLSRRDFLRRSALAAAGVTIVPAHVLGLGGAKPRARRNLAGIGVAGQGERTSVNSQEENIVALATSTTSRSGTFQRPRREAVRLVRKMLTR